MSDNLSAFRAGMMKFQKQMEEQMNSYSNNCAAKALFDAVNEWNDAYSLTGNLENSYAAGVFSKGRLINMLYAKDVADVEPAEDSYAIPGSYRWVRPEREDPNSPGQNILIRQYKKGSGLKFQPVSIGKYGSQDAYEFINSYHASGKGWEIVVVVAAPYAEYLQSKRHLDVIQNSYNEVKNGLFVKLIDVKL